MRRGFRAAEEYIYNNMSDELGWVCVEYVHVQSRKKGDVVDAWKSRTARVRRARHARVILSTSKFSVPI